MMSRDVALIEALKAENASLREQLAEARGGDVRMRLQALFRLSRQQAKLLAQMWKAPGPIEKWALYDNVFADPATGEGPEVKIVDVQICKLRARLREAGCADAVKTIWGSGYELTAAGRALVASRLQPQHQQERAAA